MHFSYEIWVWLIFWICLLVWIFPTHWFIPGQKTNRETPIEILKKRLTMGEITKEEFVDIKKRIEIN
jgi:putative membrane protein